MRVDQKYFSNSFKFQQRILKNVLVVLDGMTSFIQKYSI